VLRLTCLATAVIALSGGMIAHAQTPAPASSEPIREDVMLRARVVTEDKQNKMLIAEGDVEVRVGARVLRADRLIYNRDAQTMRAQGSVQITDNTGQVQFADEIEVDDGFRNGFATRFAMRMENNAIATASAAIRSDGVRNTLEQVIYTGCPICEGKDDITPTWSLRARRAVQNQETQMISYQDAVLEIRGVPILYVPYFAHPDPTTERRSGLLAPDLGVSSKIGPFYEQPYYYVIDPSQDVTVSPLLSTGVAPLIKVDYRKRFFSGYVQADASFTNEQFFGSNGDKFGEKEWRSHLYGSGRFNINQDWQWGFGVETQTDDLYDLRYDIDGEDDLRGLYTSQPRQLMNQVYTTGQTESFYLEAGLFGFQGLRAGDDDGRFPKVLPTVFAEKVFDFGKAGQLATDVSAAVLVRDDPAILPTGQQSLDSIRSTASAEWGSQYIVGPGVVVEPFAIGRGDFYKLDDGGDLGERDVTRVLGVAGAQVSMPFIRTGKYVDLLVEPIAMVAYGTDDANDEGIPNEDSLLFEADESNIFKPNPVSNYDLWEGGGRAALGLSTTARFGDGVELNGTIGRRWRQESDPAFNELSNLAEEKSDYVASVRATIGPTFNTSARLRFDDELEVNRMDFDVTGKVWRLEGGARYFKVVRNSSGSEDEGLVFGSRIRVTDRWSAIFEQARNVALDLDIKSSFGIAYNDECSFFALTYERSGAVDRTLEPSESIKFQFVLTGLGGVADNNFD
jgi:LPS-assembly protein